MNSSQWEREEAAERAMAQDMYPDSLYLPWDDPDDDYWLLERLGVYDDVASPEEVYEYRHGDINTRLRRFLQIGD